jgi:NAD(P)H-dependent FMN reductase
MTSSTPLLVSEHSTPTTGGGGRPLRIVALSTSLRPDSVSRALVGRLALELTQRGAEVEVVDLCDFEPVFCDSKDVERYPQEYGELAVKIAEADGVLLGFGIYNGAPSSSAWNVLQIVGPYLADQPLGMVSAGGSPKGFYCIANLVVWLMFTQGVRLLPKTIHANPDAEHELDVRVPELADAFFAHVARLARVR